MRPPLTLPSDEQQEALVRILNTLKPLGPHLQRRILEAAGVMLNIRLNVPGNTEGEDRKAALTKAEGRS
jgi:hypothetical protein